MRWFKHISNSQNDETISELMDEFGAEGYGVWWIILERIAQLIDETDRCFARFSLKVWATSARVSVKKFQNIIEFLEKKQVFNLKLENKILTIECPKLLKYRDEWTERKAKVANKTPDKLPSESRESPDILNDELELDTDTELDNKDITNVISCAPAKNKKSEPFEEFWKAYPRHENRKKAKDIWARKKLDAKSAGIIADVVNRKANHAPWQDAKFIPHATTYLNGERWQDEIKKTQEIANVQQSTQQPTHPHSQRYPKSATKQFWENQADILRRIADEDRDQD